MHTQGFQHVGGPEDIGGGGLQRRLVRAPHERLRGQMKHHLRLHTADGFLNQLEIADVPNDLAEERLRGHGFMEIR